MSSRTRRTIARAIFFFAGLHGLVVMLAMPASPRWKVGNAVTAAPQFYYGFISVTLAWQFVFFLIATDPVRYRPLMLLAALAEKFFFVAIILGLVGTHHIPSEWLGPAIVDGIWGLGFIFAFAIVKPSR